MRKFRLLTNIFQPKISMTVKGGTTPACAACKYQRRKCSPTCPLAPYFPANQPKMFQNVHRLFGVSNVTKTLEKLKTKDQKDDAMRSIIYEAEMRYRFPVNGCRAVIAHLQEELDLACEELQYICANLRACREQMISGNKPGSSLDCCVEFGSSSSNDGAAVPAPFFENGQFLLNENSEGLCAENAAKPLLTLDPCSDTMNINLASIQAQMDAFGIHDKRNNIDFEEHQFNNAAIFDHRLSYMESKIEARDAHLSSPESSLEDAGPAAEHGCQRDMKGGAVAVENGCCRRELRTAASASRLSIRA